MEKKSYYHFIVYYKDKLVFDGDEHALKEMAPSWTGEIGPGNIILLDGEEKIVNQLKMNFSDHPDQKNVYEIQLIDQR
ncbi:hypothetical protein QUF84_01135 [Fictibacillus enclensis]|uniref:hypothetical protein n=1 Tax=Fictibacillus enclensis TaxID=1017270 RepID=UPI0025A08365|nr:hypothetical protein [Fictibacillus enclensis]MDM5335898.1 hypothetical protein [Fictibacillus enclensis]